MDTLETLKADLLEIIALFKKVRTEKINYFKAKNAKNKNKPLSLNNIIANNPIKDSVGKNAKNDPADVITVQRLLNKISKTKLKENGICDDALVAAIIRLQKRISDLGEPEGRVMPNGKTWNMLLAMATPKPKLKKEDAVEAEEQYVIPPTKNSREYPLKPKSHGLSLEDLNNPEIDATQKAEQLAFEAFKYMDADIPMPEFVYDDDNKYPSYATFKDGKIIIRPTLFSVGAEYKSYNAKVSIVMHEYKHCLNDRNKIYTTRFDDKGGVINYNELSISTTEEENAIEQGEGNEVIIYLLPGIQPSNYCLDEISAYSYQLELHETNALLLEDEEVEIIKDKIETYKKKLEESKEYEKANYYLPSGYIFD